MRLIDISSIEKKLIGKIPRLNNYQIKNLSMAIAAAKLCNVKEKNIYNCLKKIKDVNGRLELIKTFPNNVRVYVDFAHTPDALLKSLKALKSDRKDNITVVFGCGGDRDFKKRPLMAKIASSHCKKIFITDDNPRGARNHRRSENKSLEILRTLIAMISVIEQKLSKLLFYVQTQTK